MLHSPKCQTGCYKSLSIYDFDLQCKRGSTHVDAYLLSRRHQDEPAEEDEQLQALLENTKLLRKKAEKFELQAAKSIHIGTHLLSATIAAKGGDNPQPDFTVDTTHIPVAEQVVKDPSSIRDDILEQADGTNHSISIQEWRNHQLGR